MFEMLWRRKTDILRFEFCALRLTEIFVLSCQCSGSQDWNLSALKISCVMKLYEIMKNEEKCQEFSMFSFKKNMNFNDYMNGKPVNVLFEAKKCTLFSTFVSKQTDSEEK